MCIYKNVCVYLYVNAYIYVYVCGSAWYMHADHSKGALACRNHNYPLQKHFAGCVCAYASCSLLFLPCRDEEGGEHLRKRSMHLPFTFATGEALLYQSAYPLPGFPDPFQSKGKTSKYKKISHSHGVRSQKNGIDPRSLLGAVMRQDKAVYASHPAPAPNHSFSSSFVDQLKDVSLLDAGRDAWSMGAAPVSSRGDQVKEELVDLQQEDPLLTTLDSLSIKSDESCSNNELFSALEGLGLNAEDLELLLLDEKMVMVNMDPDHNQFLNNCLTSNKILSYIHTTLVSKREGGQQVCPKPGTSPSPCGDTTTCQDHADYEDSQYLPQHVVQPSVAPGQLPALLWEQPLHAVPGQPTLLPPEPAKEEELSDGLQWRPAGEEGLLHFLQPVQGTAWDKAPSLPPGAPCPQVPPRARQLEGDFPAMHPTQEDAHLSFSLPSQCQGCVGPLSQPKQCHLLVNGLCGHGPDSAPHVLPSSSSSPWQDYVSPLLGSSAQPGFYSISQDLISQHQGCLGPGPGTPTVHFNLNGFCSMETAGSGGSQEEMAPYPSFSPPSSYQLIPEKQLSPVPSMPQHPFPSSAAGCFGSTGSPLETPYGTYTSALSQESRHRVRAFLHSHAQYFLCWYFLGVSAQGGTHCLVGRQVLICSSWCMARKEDLRSFSLHQGLKSKRTECVFLPLEGGCLWV